MKNRRNYYRLLQVQPDAAPEVIKASFRTLMQKLRFHPDLGGDEWNASLLNEAYAVLSDPARRAEYDASRSEARMGLGVNGRAPASQRPYRPEPVSPGPEAMREGFDSYTCPVCLTLNHVPVGLAGTRRCSACASPLPPAQPRGAGSPGERAVPRLERHLPVRFALAEADHRTGTGTAEDLSSQGMRFTTRTRLPRESLLRLECALLSAVARVVTCRLRGDGRYVVGVEFVTVEFAHRSGSLFDVEA